MKAMGILHCADSSFMGYGALANLSQNGLIRAGVEMRGDEMTRKWGELSRKGNDDTDEEQLEKLDKLTQEMEKWKVRELFRSASCLCGYMGGCLLFVDTGEDNLANPLILDSMTFAPDTFKGFRLIEPYLVTPGGYNSTNPMREDYFKPSLWYVQGIPVHSSRLIYFAENKLASLLKPAYNFFGLPLAQKVIDAVAHYTENREAAGRLLQKYAVTVLKTNMEEVLSGGFDQALKNRIQYFVQNRSNDGCAAIDKDMEDLVIQTTSLAGVTDIVRQSMEYVAAMFCEPVTKMWGLSPNGFSSGDVELRNHYDNIKAQQEKMFGEPIRRVLRVLQQNLYGEIDDSIIFNFLPLSEDDERKIAETNKIQADTDAVLITNGVISEEEARERLIADANSGYNTLTEREDDFPSFEMPEETPTEKEVVIE
jgi:phage-related protein (TIGR01555 family)